MIHRRLFLLVASLVFVTGLIAAKPELYPGLSRKWQYYQSPNFELYSANNDRDSRDVLEKMELLCAVFAQEFGFAARIPKRVTIYYFSEEEEFRAYAPPRFQNVVGFAGYSYAYPDEMILVMAPSGKRRWARELAYRQCVPFVLQTADIRPPEWFQIGLAELMASLKEEREQLVIGEPRSGHVEMLKKHGFDPIWQVLARESHDVGSMIPGQRQLYDAECWAILHYCTFMQSALSQAQRAELLNTARSEISRNRPRTFERVMLSAFAPDQSDMSAELARYLKAGRLGTRKISRPIVPNAEAFERKEVSSAEMITQLAELGYRANQAPYGAQKLEELMGNNPSIALYELFGAVARQERKLDKAREFWGKAVEFGTTNVGVLNELCRIEGGIVFTNFDLGFQLPETRAARLRQLLLRSISYAPKQKTAYEMLLWVEAYAAEPKPENVELACRQLELAEEQAPLVALALGKFRKKDFAGALQTLDILVESKCTTWIAAWAEILRASIEKRPVNKELINRRPNRE